MSYNQQVICILNLKPGDIDKVLCHNLSFSQAFVVIHAYNHHVDWANLIYSHCILNGETKYLKDFIAVNKLTPGLVRNCVRRQVNYCFKEIIYFWTFLSILIIINFIIGTDWKKALLIL